MIEDHEQLIHDTAIGAGLRPTLLRALVMQESGGDTWAYRPEPHYRYLVDVRTGRPFRRLTRAEAAAERPPADFPAPPGVSPVAEWWGQQASFGLCQVMGAVGRELGLQARFLTALCDPYIGLQLGARHLENQIRRYGERDGLAAYNAGPGGRHGERGQAYASAVLEREALHA